MAKQNFFYQYWNSILNSAPIFKISSLTKVKYAEKSVNFEGNLNLTAKQKYANMKKGSLMRRQPSEC